MDFLCINFLPKELRVSVWLLLHLHLNWDTLIYHFSSLVHQAVLLFSPLIYPICLLLLLITNTLKWPLLYIGHIVIILRFFVAKRHRVDFLFCKSDSGDFLVVLKPCRQVLLDQFQPFFFLATLDPKIFVLYCLGVFSSPIFCCFANKLCFIVIFTTTSPLVSLNLVFCSQYIFQKVSLYPGLLTLSWTCFFVIGIMLFLLVLTD